MKGGLKKGAEGRRIVADIFLHKARAERKGAEGFSEMMLGASGGLRGPPPPPPEGPVQPGPARPAGNIWPVLQQAGWQRQFIRLPCSFLFLLKWKQMNDFISLQSVKLKTMFSCVRPTKTQNIHLLNTKHI